MNHNIELRMFVIEDLDVIHRPSRYLVKGDFYDTGSATVHGLMLDLERLENPDFKQLAKHYHSTSSALREEE